MVKHEFLIAALNVNLQINKVTTKNGVSFEIIYRIFISEFCDYSLHLPF